ncbi:hypothetical protein VB002_07630 [Campylobacter concisus]
MRNLLICGLNAVNFNFCLPKFIPPFSVNPYMGVLLKFDWVKSPSKVNLITILRVYKFMVRVRVS